MTGSGDLQVLDGAEHDPVVTPWVDHLVGEAALDPGDRAFQHGGAPRRRAPADTLELVGHWGEAKRRHRSSWSAASTLTQNRSAVE